MQGEGAQPAQDLPLLVESAPQPRQPGRFLVVRRRLRRVAPPLRELGQQHARRGRRGQPLLRVGRGEPAEALARPSRRLLELAPAEGLAAQEQLRPSRRPPVPHRLRERQPGLGVGALPLSVIPPGREEDGGHQRPGLPATVAQGPAQRQVLLVEGLHPRPVAGVPRREAGRVQGGGPRRERRGRRGPRPAGASASRGPRPSGRGRTRTARAPPPAEPRLGLPRPGARRGRATWGSRWCAARRRGWLTPLRRIRVERMGQGARTHLSPLKVECKR